MVSAHYLENYLSLSFHISHADGLGEDMTCIAFGFTRSKVKVTKFFFVKRWFLLIILRNIKLITELLYSICWLVLVVPWPLLILDSLGQRSKSQGSLVTKMYTWFLLFILRTIYHIAFIFHMLIGQGQKDRFKKKVSPLVILRTVYRRGFIYFT